MEFWKDEAAVEHWRTRLHDARTHNIGLALAAKKLNAGQAKLLSDRYWDEQSNRMKLFDDAIETLDRLRDAGFRLGLLTNGPAEMQRWKLARFPIAERVDVVVIEGEFGHGKPDARVFQHALASVGAVCVAFAAEFLDPSLKTSEQVENELGIPVLFSVPRGTGHELLHN